jgi:hypothetical protein
MDKGIRPYASSAKTYSEMMDEETEQYYRSRNYNINPSLKQPYTFSSYTEMMYLYSGGEQKKEDNIDPVIIATVTSPDYEFFDFFVKPVDTTTYYFKEDCNNLDAWTVVNSSGCSTLATPSGYFTTEGVVGATDTWYFSMITASLSGIPDNFTFEYKINTTADAEYTISQISFDGGSNSSIYLYPKQGDGGEGSFVGGITLGDGGGGGGSVDDAFSNGVDNTFKFVIEKTGENLATVNAYVNDVLKLTATNCLVPDTKNSLRIFMGSLDYSNTGEKLTVVTDHIYIY